MQGKLAPFHRQTATLAAAVALPLIILVGLQLYTQVNAERRKLETNSEAQAADVMRLVDAQVLAEIKVAQVLASTISSQPGDLAAAYALSREFRSAAVTWRTVRLADAATGVELFDLRRPLGAGTPVASTSVVEFPDHFPRIGGVVMSRDGSWSLPLEVPVIRDGRVLYALTVELDPGFIHRLAMAKYPKSSVVSAVVDRTGHFISRSLGQHERLGDPGSTYLQEATKRGGHGIYTNVTLEGVPSYTAYVTSDVSGWSTHVALPATTFDAARLWSYVIWAVVLLLCALLSGALVWMTLRDLAEVRSEQERLLQGQKMEAVGHLTGGIAHDFNNLLTAIIGGLDLYLRRSDATGRDRRYLEGALEAAQRGAKLTSRLLAFSRTEQLGVKTVDVQATLAGMSELLRQSLGPTIDIRVVVNPGAEWMSTDPGQLELALLNLAVNARDAMPHGGTVTFEAKRLNSRREGKPWACVDLSVTDTGAGMEPDVRAQAFDPFFTTKRADKGTGLGLAQVYAFARQSGGDVKIESELGMGTRVCLLLPLADASETAPQPERPLPTGALAPAGEGKRILVLDDDQSVREVLVESLKAAGYDVFEASSGEQALAALPEFDPDLIVLDFVMPGLNGAEVAARVRQTRPKQKILMVSGHYNSALLRAAGGNIPVLKKPFDGETLVRHVSQAFEGS